MKKSKILYCILTVICISLCFTLFSCGEDEPQGATTVTISQNGSSDYTLVYTQSDSLSGRWANALRAELGLTAAPSADSSEAELEILVGNTARDLSQELKAAAHNGKAEDSWVWAFGYKDGKLAIYANCQSAFDLAMQTLKEEYISDGVFSVSSKLWRIYEFTKAQQLEKQEEEEEQKRKEEEANKLMALNLRQEKAKADNEKFTLSDFDNTDPNFHYDWPTKTNISVTGSPKEIWTTDYSDPDPIEASHPRVMVTADMIPGIKAALESEEYAQIAKDFWVLADSVIDGVMPTEQKNGKTYRYNGTEIAAIEAKALAYLITGHKAYAYEAISCVKNLIKTVNFTSVLHGDTYHGYGHVILVTSFVYDWCYDVLTESDKNQLINGVHNYLLCQLEYSYPPAQMSAVSGHGTGPQFYRHYLTMAVAFADERPDWWDFCGGRFYDLYVPVNNVLFESGWISQGTSYGPMKLFSYLWSGWLISTATGEMPYDEGLKNCAYTLFSQLMPNDRYFESGDTTRNKNGGTVDPAWMYIAAALFEDPAVLANAKFFSNGFKIYNYSDLETSTPSLALIFVSQCEAPNESRTDGLSLINYTAYPGGLMTARESWAADAAMTYMKIGELTMANHDNMDSGSFQIYYKGLLATASGTYSKYGSPSHYYYLQATVGVNGLLIYNPALKSTDGGYYSGGQKKHSEAGTIENWLGGSYDMGTVIGQASGYKADKTAKYAYIAGDITKAYDSSTVNHVSRRMLTVYTGDENAPMIFFVFDKMDAKNEDYKKSFLLHTVKEPTLIGAEADITLTPDMAEGLMTATVTNEGGKLVLTNVFGADKMHKIGGSGYAYWIGNENDFDGTAASGKNLLDEYTTNDNASNIWGRIELTARGEKLTNMLNVMYVTDAGSNASLTVAPIESKCSNVKGAQVANICSMFVLGEERSTDAIEFTTEGDGKIQYYISGVHHGKWTVYVNGAKAGAYTATEEGGLLEFTANSGDIRLVPSEEIAPSDKGKIIYETNGGILPAGAPEFYNYGYELILDTVPTRENDRFDGWYLDNEFTEPITKISAESVGSVKIYAKWIPIYIKTDFSDVSLNITGNQNVTDSVTGITFKQNDNDDNVFKTVTEGGESYLQWIAGSNQTKNGFFILTNETVNFSSLNAEEAVVSFKVDISRDGSRSILPFHMRLNSTSGLNGNYNIFTVTSDGKIHLGYGTGEVIGEVGSSTSSVRILIDFKNGVICAYGDNGNVIATLDFIAPTKAEANGITTLEAWRATLTSYIFYCMEDAAASGAGSAIRIEGIEVSASNIFTD